MKNYKSFLIEAPKKKHIVFTFGRMNPPTTGHEVVVKKVMNVANSDEHRIYVSQSKDAKRNPLSYMIKIQFLRRMFPQANVVFDRKIKTPFDVLKKVIDEGFKKITMVVGSDRVREFNKSVKGFIDKAHSDKGITFKAVSAGKRDPDAEGVAGMSASKLRDLARENNFKEFKSGLPTSLKERDKKELFNQIRTGMGISMNETIENSENDFVVDDIVKHELDESICVVRGKTASYQLVTEVIQAGEMYRVGEIIKLDRNNFVYPMLEQDSGANAEKNMQKRETEKLKEKNEDRQVNANESVLVKHGNNPAKALSSITPMSTTKAKKFIKSLSIDDSFKLFTALNNDDLKTVNSMVMSAEEMASNQLEVGTKKTLKSYMKSVPHQKIEVAPHIKKGE
jgi:hypothetical protein